MAKKLTEAQRDAIMSELIDTRKDPKGREHAAHVAKACRFLDRAVALYGCRRVVAVARAHYDDPELHLAYWRRWRARQNRHLIPMGALVDAYGVADVVAFNIALAPRVAA